MPAARIASVLGGASFDDFFWRRAPLSLFGVSAHGFPVAGLVNILILVVHLLYFVVRFAEAVALALGKTPMRQPEVAVGGAEAPAASFSMANCIDQSVRNMVSTYAHKTQSVVLLCT